MVGYRSAFLLLIAIIGIAVLCSIQRGSAKREGVATPSNLEISAGDVNHGRVLARQCLGCHSLDGSKEISPSWKDLYGTEVSLQDGTRVIVDDRYILESIRFPNANISAGFPPTMPDFPDFSDQDISDLIAYMKSLSVFTVAASLPPGPMASPSVIGISRPSAFFPYVPFQ